MIYGVAAYLHMNMNIRMAFFQLMSSNSSQFSRSFRPRALPLSGPLGCMLRYVLQR